MKIGKINSFINNPKLYYKLDPGEPGIPYPSNASNSIARVALHEATNIRRFKREAAEDGGIVVSSFIGLNIQFKGSFLAATSGKSKALVIMNENEEKNKLPLIKISEENKNPGEPYKNQEKITDTYKNNTDITLKTADKNDEKTENINQNTSLQEIPLEIQEMESEIKNLETEKQVLKNKLESGINSNKTNPVTENNIEKIEKKIKYLEAQMEIEKQKKFLKTLGNSNTIAIKLAGMNSTNLMENAQGNFIDTII